MKEKLMLERFLDIIEPGIDIVIVVTALFYLYILFQKWTS